MLRDLFGEDYDEQRQEARERLGDSAAWRESEHRTAGYTLAEWQQVDRETDRTHIHRRFYPCSQQMHRSLDDLYVSTRATPRRTTSRSTRRDCADYVREAIHANAERQRG